MADYDALYNVICPQHGKVQIGQDGYDEQMGRPDDPWACPICSEDCDFDDASYEAGNVCVFCGEGFPYPESQTCLSPECWKGRENIDLERGDQLYHSRADR